MRGDIYIAAEGFSSSRLDTPLDPEVIDMLKSQHIIESSIAIRVAEVESKNGPVQLVATSMERPLDPRLLLKKHGSAEQTWQAVKDGAVLLSEPLANRLGATPGKSIELLTPQGWRSFLIAGIYADYGSTRGIVRMSLDVYRSLWNDYKLNGLALLLVPKSNVDAATAILQKQLINFPAIQVNPSAALRRDALAVFDRTFAITTAMQLITTIVAFIGVLSSLLALQLEKEREIGILRALGLSLAEMRRLTLWETGLLGASAGLLALPAGYILAWILIFIINQRSFGWTLQMKVDPAPFAQAFLLSISASLLAAIYPAWRLSRMQAAAALRGE
jgi:putative ABC transport system permease protein